MKKYYARWKDGFCSYWIIYKKRKYWFDKKVCKFFSSSTIYSRKIFEQIVKPELERLEKKEK